MSSPRRVSLRRTMMGRSGSRPVGAYRQTNDWPSSRTMYRALAGRMPIGWHLEFTGQVAVPASFDYAALVEMCELDTSLGFGVPLTDLLARVGLDAGAEVLVASDDAGRSLGIPVRNALGHDRARLTLGSERSPIALGDGFPVRLDVPGWTDTCAPIVVESLRAVGFAEFVGCS